MADISLRSWGLPGPYPHHALVPDIHNLASFDPLRKAGASDPRASYLAVGNGRSYGDVGLNPRHGAVLTSGWDRVVQFDPACGTVTCESGLSLGQLIAATLPAGWFPAVVPGTRHVTIGGAIANDVHGKNHHVAGSFGDHVQWIDLWRSDRGRVRCSGSEMPDLFRATLGGLGMTGIILRAGLRLRRVSSGWMQVQTTRFVDLAQFFEINAEREKTHEYTVAWIDCLPHGGRAGRGIYYAATHVDEPAEKKTVVPPQRKPFAMPFAPPWPLINRVTLEAFNFAYWLRANEGESRHPLHPFFFPLDSLQHWNRIYGSQGLYQFQCVVPFQPAPETVQALLEVISRARQGSFLAVLKTFGERVAPGWMSFARPGVTLALDFPNRGFATRRLFDQLASIVREAGGALYPAKDALMPSRLFQEAYPRWEQLEAMRDPRCNSAFWRRVTASASTR